MRKNVLSQSVLSVAATVFSVMSVVHVACADDTDYTTSILSRPLDFAVTCMSSDRAFVDVAECDETDGTAVTWVLDGDRGGIFVSTLPGGSHFDFDPFIPGYSPIPVGEGLVAIEASPDSRYVFVAGQDDDGPALSLIDGDFFNLKAVRARFALACPVLDMTVVSSEQFPAGYAIAALLDCESGDQVWTLAPVDGDVAGAGDAFVDAALFSEVPGEARWLSFSEDVLMVVSSRLPIDAFESWDYIITYSGFSQGNPESVAVPVVNDSALVPALASVDGPAGCDESGGEVMTGYVSGRPAISPGGDFMYVPIGVPAGIAVFDAGFNRIDTHAIIDGVDTSDTAANGPDDDWNIANLLARWQGYLDVRLDSPPLGVSFVTLEDGLRGIAWLYGGQIVRIMVEPTADLPWPHRTENDLDFIESSAYMPVVTWRGEDIERAITTRTDLPWFGSRAVVSPASEDEKYVYYGITFNGDVEAEAPETWYLTYEGALPGAFGFCGSLEQDPDRGDGFWTLSGGDAVDFCRAGVEGRRDDYPGDILEATLPLDSTCEEFSGRRVEFRVDSVSRDVLNLSRLSVGIDTDIPSSCPSDRIEWRVRAAGQWVVNGTRTGFLHPWTSSDDGACVAREDADPIFIGRAATAMPAGQVIEVDSCPIALGMDSRIDWAATWFRNPLFSLHVLSGCRIGENYNPVAIPPERDTVLKFGMETGRIPFQNDIGGLASGLVVIGTTLYALDSSNGRILVLDSSDMTISGSWF